VHSWAAGLAGGARDAFLSMRLGDLMGPPHLLLNRDWVRQLSADKNMELASGTLLTARKPVARKRKAAPKKASPKKAVGGKPAAKVPSRAKTISSGESVKPPSPRARAPRRPR
jgi:hypothetical protein